MPESAFSETERVAEPLFTENQEVESQEKMALRGNIW